MEQEKDEYGEKQVDIEVLRRRNEVYAKWFKEIGLLFLAATVVQNIVSGSPPLDPIVLAGAIVAGVSYYRAYRLMEQL